MALVPYRVSGAAADQSAHERLFQIGGVSLRLIQDPHSGGSLRPLAQGARPSHQADSGEGSARGTHVLPRLSAGAILLHPSASSESDLVVPPSPPIPPAPAAVLDGLANVGLVVWQSGFVLAEFLLRRPPWGPSWRDVSVIDLGSGTGIVGLAVALAGATALLTDLPHVLPLTTSNVEANYGAAGGAGGRACGLPVPSVAEHRWGDADSAAALRALLADRTRSAAQPSLAGDDAAAAGVGSGGQDTPSLITVADEGASCLAGHSGRDRVPDLITAADVLYEPLLYGALLDSLQALCASHTVVYISYRSRSVEEEGFAALAGQRGFAAEEVPAAELHDEYCDGQYHILRLCPWNAMDVS